MEFSGQEYWSGLPFPSAEDFPDPGTESGSPALQADAFTIWATREAKKKERMDIRNKDCGVTCVAPFSSPVSVTVVRSSV